MQQTTTDASSSAAAVDHPFPTPDDGPGASDKLVSLLINVMTSSARSCQNATPSNAPT